MSKWRRFWSNPYKWGLWHWIGGRKWTFIMRDFAYQNPMLMLIIGFGAGMYFRPSIDWDHLAPFLAGLLLAHLFWATKWRKGQGKQSMTKEV